jgi:hypothetical protein
MLPLFSNLPDEPEWISNKAPPSSQLLNHFLSSTEATGSFLPPHLPPNLVSPLATWWVLVSFKSLYFEN